MRALLFLWGVLSLISSAVCLFDGLSWFSSANKQIGRPREDVELYINDNDLENILNNKKYLLIYFYSDTCGYCDKFNQDFGYIAQLYNGGNGLDSFQVLKTNGKKNRRLIQLFGIQHYPTLKIVNFETKEIFTFDAERTVQLIVDYISHHTGAEPDYGNFESPIKKLDDGNYKDFITSSSSSSTLAKVIVFAASYTKAWENSHYPQHFYQQFPQQFPQVEFAIVNADHSNTTALQRHFRVANFPSILKIDTKTGAISTFQTNSQNFATNDKLAQDQCLAFVTGALEEGVKKYASLEELRDAAANSAEKYEVPQGWGMQVVQKGNSAEDLSLEEEYEELMYADEL